MSYGPTLLPDWLSRRSVTHPHVTALWTPSGELTYAELYRKATAMAGGLQQLHVNGPVGLLAKDPMSVALVVHALIQANLVVIPLNWRLTPRELSWQLKDAGASWVLYDEAEMTAALEIEKQVPELRIQTIKDIPLNDEPMSHSHLPLDAVHAIIYTSGTTGNPKGTLITYGNEWWSATGSALQLGVLPTDRWLSPLPLFHVGGLSVLLRSVIYGTTAVLQGAFDAAAANDAIDNGAVSVASLVPTMLQRMLDLRGGNPFPPSLRAILLGGSAASQSLLDMAKAHKAPVAQSYGLTETASQVCTLMPEDFQRKLGSSGLPAMMNDVVIVEERAKDAEDPLIFQCAPGVAGEILVRGPSVTPGYLNRPDATADVIRKGWLWTGDVGYLDDEGYLFVLDRRRDLIVSGGENIYPAEVESMLESHESIQEAAVIPMADSTWGQVPVAVVAMVQGREFEPDLLAAYSRQLLAAYKVPRHWFVVDALPRNASGKLLRRILQEWLDTGKLQEISK